MAIPFNLPSDEETEENYRRLDQLLADLYDVLRQILLRPRNISVPPLRITESSNLTLTPERNFEPPSSPGAPELMEERLLALPDLVRSAMSPTLNDLVSRRLRETIEPQSNCDVSSPASSVALSRYQVSDRTDGPPPPVRPPRSNARRVSKRSRSPKTSYSTKLANSTVKPRAVQKKWVHLGEELRSIAEDFRSTFQKKNASKTDDSSESPVSDFKASSLFSLLVPSPFGRSVWTTVIFIVGWRIFTRLR